MKCEECGTSLELLAEGGRYSRFGYRHHRSYQCPKCKAVYGMDGFQLYRVRSDIDDSKLSEMLKKVRDSSLKETID